MSEITDEELIQRIAADDESAMRQFIERHQQRVFGTAWRITGNNTDAAEDITQEVFIRVFRAAPRFRPDARVTTWLITICRNCSIAWLRRNRRHPLLSFFNQDGELAHDPVDPSCTGPSDGMENKETASRIAAALAVLPEQQRTAMILREYEDMDYEEIAKVLKTSIPSVKSLLFRARQALRQELADLFSAT